MKSKSSKIAIGRGPSEPCGAGLGVGMLTTRASPKIKQKITKLATQLYTYTFFTKKHTQEHCSRELETISGTHNGDDAAAFIINMVVLFNQKFSHCTVLFLR